MSRKRTMISRNQPPADEATERAVKQVAAIERMKRRWRDEGYNPTGHLDAMTVDGDEGVLKSHHARARQAFDNAPSADRRLPYWLMCRDIAEIAETLYARGRWAAYNRARGQ